MHYLGIDIGGSFIKYAVVDKNYTIIKSWQKPTVGFDAVQDFYDYLCQGIDCSAIQRVGVSVPGVIDKSSKILSKAASSLESICGTTVNTEVMKRLNVPVKTLNDGKAAAYCELKMGNGRNSKSSAYWIIGTGIGGCICLGDKIISGENGIAGEFSHIPLSITHGKICGIGHVASASALLAAYNGKVAAAYSVTDGKVICERYLSGEPVAQQVIDEWCLHNVMGLYTLTVTFNPEVICIGGAISEETWLTEKLRDTYYQVSSRFNKLITTRIVGCKYTKNANVLGAIWYAREGDIVSSLPAKELYT
ncbi:ROK family protein [Mixta intestinalis]|uniref:Beta-glucoside kinase n=1 Tax=Mixta intestinalis TaxID=1615494 RepID=A0A6P1Q173_9GAMM|nr:ROK family protein [Mixta intestinalis]QHM71887.1 Beta-glucoside kinase [Mixta intestinalis]